MVKHVIIPHTGFHISFEHAKEIDWEHARAIINCELIQILQGRWDGKDYEMLVDEEYDYRQEGIKVNHKATVAYQQYWTNYERKNPGTIDISKVNNTTIKGNVILVEEKK